MYISPPLTRTGPSADPSATLPAELREAITDAVLGAPDSQARAQVVADLVEEIYQSVAWITGSGTDSAELSSLRRLLAEAAAHQSRCGAVGCWIDPRAGRRTS